MYVIFIAIYYNTTPNSLPICQRKQKTKINLWVYVLWSERDRERVQVISDFGSEDESIGDYSQDGINLINQVILEKEAGALL
jgi:hypothetical protein